MARDDKAAAVIVLAERLAIVAGESGLDVFDQLYALVALTATSARELGIPLEAVRLAMWGFLNPQPATRDDQNVVRLDVHRWSVN